MTTPQAAKVAAERARRGIRVGSDRAPASDAARRQTQTRQLKERLRQLKQGDFTREYAAIAELSCIHRGQLLAEQVPCGGCENSQPVTVFGCAVHGLCTLRRKARDMRITGLCQGCKQIAPYTDATQIPPALVNVTMEQAEAWGADVGGGQEWAIGITTGPRGRRTGKVRYADYLAPTYWSILASGWWPQDIDIYAEPGDMLYLPPKETMDLARVHVSRRKLGAFQNTLRMMRDLLETRPEARYFLLMQDDTILAGPGLRTWLERHLPPASDAAAFCSLYTSREYTQPYATWAARKGWVWGACATLWQRHQLQAFVDSPTVARWKKHNGVDTAFGAFAKHQQKLVIYPTPSLAQHVGHESTMSRSRATGARRADRFIGFGNMGLLQGPLPGPDGDQPQLPPALQEDRDDARRVAAVASTPRAEGVTLITATGDRQRSFRLLENWISRQTYSGPRQWIVVDDGTQPTQCTLGQQLIRRGFDGSGMPSLNQNLLAAIPLVKHAKVLLIEDDDWYGDDYVRHMMKLLDEAEIVGQTAGFYFDLAARQQYTAPRTGWASLCRTGLRSYLLEHLAAACQEEDTAIDDRLWKLPLQQRLDRAAPGSATCVSLKNGPGRRGYTWDRKRPWKPDPDARELSKWVSAKADAELILGLHDPVGTIAVYTAGKPPAIAPDHRHARGFYCFTDAQKLPPPWQPIPAAPGQEAIHRILGHHMLARHDWTIYLPPESTLGRSPRDMIAGLSSGVLAYGYAFPDGTLVRRTLAGTFEADQRWAGGGPRPEGIVESRPVDPGDPQNRVLFGWPQEAGPLQTFVRFRHGGNAGDIIWSLPAVKALCEKAGPGPGAKAIVYLMLGEQSRYREHHPLGNVRLNEHMAQRLIPLLESQPYIERAEIWSGQPLDVNLDGFRHNGYKLATGHLTQFYFHTHRCWADVTQPWLTVEPPAPAEPTIVVNRTHRYNHLSWDDWAAAFRGVTRPIAFLGVPEEIDLAKPHLPAHTRYIDVLGLADHRLLASMIASSHCFVGNQSYMVTLADALKVRRIMEVCPIANNGWMIGGQGRNCYHREELIDAVKEWCA